MTAVEFRVYGDPAVAGSKTVLPNANAPRGHVIVDGSSKTQREHRRTWRSDVIDAARSALGDGPQLVGPVSLDVVFYRAKPKNARRSDVWPQRRPDLTKLLRALEDAITAAGIWEDDSQVCLLVIAKRYATDVEPPGAGVRISTMEDLGP